MALFSLIPAFTAREAAPVSPLSGW